MRSLVRIAAVAAGLVVATAPARAQVTLPAPELEPFNGKWHTDTYKLRGEVDTTHFGGFVRILRNGIVVDSVTTTIDSTFTVKVDLSPGDNFFTAVLRDSGFVVSPPSNRVSVYFDTGAGLYLPIPFAPGASFDLNAVNMATRADLRLFDVAGGQVIHFESSQSQTFYSFLWNGLNQSGERVRRGPLVAVATIDYPDGSHQIIRRVFLFNPEASP